MSGLYLGGELVKNWGWVRSTERFAATDVVTNQFSDRADPVGGGFLIGYKFAPWANSIIVSPFALPRRSGAAAIMRRAFVRRPGCASPSNPAAQLAAHDGLDHAHSAVAVIEAIDPGKGFAARGEEIFRVLASDFFDSLQAVG